MLLDANHGAGSVLGQRLLNELGCRVTLFGGKPDGQFAHPPEPTAENLAGSAAVLAAKADIGFCQDPDADRLAVIDEQGRYLGEEYTVAICLDQVLRHRSGPVVTNCSTSRMAEDLAEKYGVPFFRSPVGEANVVHVMQRAAGGLRRRRQRRADRPRGRLHSRQFRRHGLDLCRPWRHGTCESVSWPMSCRVTRSARRNRKSRGMPIPAALRALEKHFADARSDRLDGLRLDWPGKWLLIRASNTEPIVRIVAETPSLPIPAVL